MVLITIKIKMFFYMILTHKKKISYPCSPIPMRVKRLELKETGNGRSENASISADGRYIVFQSSATNLENHSDVNEKIDVFLYDKVDDLITRIEMAMMDHKLMETLASR